MGSNSMVELNRLAVAQRRMERRLAGTTLRDRRTNEWLRGVTKVVDVVDEAQKRKWSYAWNGNGARKMAECAPAMATGNDKTSGQAKNAKTNYPRNVEQRIGQE